MVEGILLNFERIKFKERTKRENKKNAVTIIKAVTGARTRVAWLLEETDAGERCSKDENIPYTIYLASSSLYQRSWITRVS